MNSPERSDAGSPGCGVNRRAGGFSRKLNATSHTGWARFAVWRVPLELSDSIRDQACQLFRSAQNEDLLRGRSIEAIATASVYGACRCNDRPVILDEVADSARVELSRVRNAYKTLNTELGLPTPPRRPQSFIPRFASELDVADTVRQRAFELAKGAEATIISNGCQPTGVAAACLYKAAREQGQFFTQTDPQRWRRQRR